MYRFFTKFTIINLILFFILQLYLLKWKISTRYTLSTIFKLFTMSRFQIQMMIEKWSLHGISIHWTLPVLFWTHTKPKMLPWIWVEYVTYWWRLNSWSSRWKAFTFSWGIWSMLKSPQRIILRWRVSYIMLSQGAC